MMPFVPKYASLEWRFGPSPVVGRPDLLILNDEDGTFLRVDLESVRGLLPAINEFLRLADAHIAHQKAAGK